MTPNTPFTTGDLVSLADYRPLPSFDNQYPLEYIENHQAIKLAEDGEAVTVGVCNAGNQELKRQLRQHHRKPVRFVSIDSTELAAFLARAMSGEDDVVSDSSSQDRLLLDKLANDAPIVNLVNSTIIEALRREASDIHIEAFEAEAIIRYRVDGVLQVVNSIPVAKFAAVSSRIKVMANMNIMERRMPQDGRTSVHLSGDPVDLRISVMPTVHGESIVVRIFYKKTAPKNLDQLGFSVADLERFRRMYRSPHGLLLATGPTGSGKTTTLNAALRELRSNEVKILTLEDPVEYEMPGVNQVQTHDAIGLTFDSLLRRVLRQDPNIVMVGEIRDRETAVLALRAALTGHLVLSTLHTNDSVGVIERLVNMGTEPYMLAAVLRGCIAQRLVRKVCPRCAVERDPNAAEEDLFTRNGFSPPSSLWSGEGCEWCNGTGYRGRIAIFEVLQADERLQHMIAAGHPAGEIRAALYEDGFTNLLTDGIRKCVAGETTTDELLRAVAM